MTKKMEKRLLSKLGKNIEFISSRKVDGEVLVTLKDVVNKVTVERSLRHLLRRDKIEFFANVDCNKNKKIAETKSLDTSVSLSNLLNCDNKEEKTNKEIEKSNNGSQFINREDLNRLEESIMNKLESMTKKLENITIRVRLDNQ